MTKVTNEDAYSSVVSLKGMRMCIFIAELNDLDIMVGDIGNAYLEAYTKEKIYFIAGPEFGELEGTIMLVSKAIYGLKTSGARYCKHFADFLLKRGWIQSRAHPDIWMLDKGTHWEYLCVYVDDIMVMSKDPQSFMQDLQTTFKMKGVGPPDYHLGGNFERLSNGRLSWGSKTYINKILDQYQRLFPNQPFCKKTKTPLSAKYHPELDISDLLDEDERKLYQSLIGMLQWAVTLGRYDIHHAVMTMSRFRNMPRKDHLANVKGIFSYLKNFKDASIMFNTAKFDHSQYPVVDHEWKYIYGEVKEDLPKNHPEARGKSVAFTSFCDANLLHDLVIGRSVSGILHLVNCTLIDWFSKRQNQVETAVYGSEFMAGRLAVEQIMELRYMFTMLGVPIEGPTYLFGDNLSMVTSSTVPSSSLKKRHNILSYHRVREAIWGNSGSWLW